MKYPFKTLLVIGDKGRGNPKRFRATLALDLRHYAVGFRWHRSYSGMSSVLNLWTFDFGIPLFTLEVVFRHDKPIP
jgi:hypothetical protein